MKKINLIPLIIVLILGLEGIQLVIAQRLVLAGEKFHALNQELVELQEENEAISQQISENSCLRKVQARAGELGLVKVKSIVYLKTQAPIAWKP
jgi:cell division protein FtsL